MDVNGEVTLVDSTINGGCNFVQESNSFDEVPKVMLPFVNLIRTTPIQTTVHSQVNVLLFVDVVIFVFLKRKKERKERTIRRMLIQHSPNVYKTTATAQSRVIPGGTTSGCLSTKLHENSKASCNIKTAHPLKHSSIGKGCMGKTINIIFTKTNDLVIRRIKV